MGTFAEALARSRANVPTGPCPPLPVITKNLALASDWKAARAHFTCQILKESGGVWTSAQETDRGNRASNYIYSQLSKYAQVTPQGAEVVKEKLAEIKAYTPPAISTAPRVLISEPSPVSAPARAVDTTVKSVPTPKQGISTSGASTVKTKYATLGSGLGSVLPGVGTVTGGVVGGLIDLFPGTGKSRCPGPFNYNPATGGCDPKPGRFAPGGTNGASSCPAGTTYDPATGQCKVGGVKGAVQRGLPGGATGYVAQEFTPTTAFGMQGFVPQTVPQTRLMCPAGYVLYGNKSGRNPGMEICLPKGFLANKHRKWPKSPNPALSAQDMRTLNRIRTLQNKIKRVATTAGFTTKKR